MSLDLLSLPQELRDLIYEHVYHAVGLTWTCKHSKSAKRTDTVCIEQAPVAGLLTTCVQISDDYHKSIFKKLHATVHWAMVPPTLNVAHNRTFQAASNQIRYISLIMEDATKDKGKFVFTSQALQKCCPRL
ncbi:hypothetical protein E8E11_000399 [Didymella keratinophila]|nr:hypothetical protein E8E11_000399 [Didymella keratinophila]